MEEEKQVMEGAATAARRRLVIGVGFWVQGFRLFPWLGVNFFLKDGMGVAASSLQILQASANLPMVAKPLIGLLSDAVPIRGHRRLPYVAIGALLQAISWLAIALWQDISLQVLTIFLLLSNFGASICEVANDAIVAESGKKAASSSGSGQLQSFAWMFGSSAGALGNLLGGIALSYFSPKVMFLFFAILLLLQFFTTVAIPEGSLKLPKVATSTNLSALTSIRKQVKELSCALSMPEMFWSIIWFTASYAVIPFLLGTMFFYQTEVLRLDSSVIGLSKVFGQVALLAWSMSYNKYFKTMSARKLLSVLQFVTALVMLSDVLFVQGVYRKVGIPDSIYTIVFSGLLEGLMFFKVLPFSVHVAKLCPAGCEGSVMAFVMSALALATIVSGYLGVALAAFMGVSGDDFSALPACLLIEAACTMLPLCCSSLIKERREKEKKQE
ncbi:transporter, folate-biopterin transporter isoform X1 [Zea mays]|uniref:Folate-biopterin transporter 7 n=1 Tax=Zea mays TaxID=4577 RepID=B4FI43_MAIZE|nr:transporter, folate-biopterin transporter [Zea mays]XP_023156002.1 transporter, folate-biopterin transporter isoform X1 [Zea mays]ACF81786.1 unknown [Zea mays]ACF86722.1 unknown [Zea mays]|eukprot:NP_001132791.1 transporter, folate-biopterin transporter [Zea mays]